MPRLNGMSDAGVSNSDYMYTGEQSLPATTYNTQQVTSYPMDGQLLFGIPKNTLLLMLAAAVVTYLITQRK